MHDCLHQQEGRGGVEELLPILMKGTKVVVYGAAVLLVLLALSSHVLAEEEVLAARAEFASGVGLTLLCMYEW